MSSHLHLSSLEKSPATTAVSSAPISTADSLADLLERTSGYYHPRFEEMIRRLNAMPTGGSSGDCLRLCVEAVNLVLQTQTQIAGELRRLERRTRAASPTAAPIRLRRSA